MILEYFTIAWKNISKRKLRSALTIIGIFISIAILYLMVSLSLGLQDAVNEEFDKLGADKFYIHPENSLATFGGAQSVERPLTINDAKKIEGVNGVLNVGYTSFTVSEISFGDETRFFKVVGSPLEDKETINMLAETVGIEPETGRLLQKGDKRKVIVGSKYNEIFSRPLEVGHKIFINDYEFRVVGVMKSQGNSIDDTSISIPYDDFSKVFNKSDNVDIIIVQFKDNYDIDEVFDSVSRELRHFRNLEKGEEDFAILNPKNLIDKLNKILNIILIFMISVATVSLIVGGIGISNTMYTSIMERKKQIGVMKAVGAKNSTISKIFLIESGILGLFGGIVGIFTGYGLTKIIESAVEKSMNVAILNSQHPLWLIFGALLFSFFVGAFSGMFPANKAAKINTVDALRYE